MQHLLYNIHMLYLQRVFNILEHFPIVNHQFLNFVE